MLKENNQPNVTAFLNQLRKALSEPLPGGSAQAKMAPPHRSIEKIDGLSGNLVRESAVLILLWEEGAHIYTTFILRNVYDGIHSNQIAFPGGKYEKSDADFVATALRESQEEVGIEPETVTVLGQLTPLFISPSRFLVYPIVGYSKITPTFILDPVEVQKIIPCKLFDFLKPDYYVIQDMEIRGKIMPSIPCFKIEGHLIWGATAMIFNELLEIIKPIV